MTAPAAIANAVADALGLDTLPDEIDLELPLTPARVWALIQAANRRSSVTPPVTQERRMHGEAGDPGAEGPRS
jgi:hypothetical protein